MGKPSPGGQTNCEMQHHRKTLFILLPTIARALQFTVGITGALQSIGDTQVPCQSLPMEID